MSLLTDLYKKLDCLCRKADDLEDRVEALEAGGGVDGFLVDSDDDQAADTDDDPIYAD